MDNPLTLLQSQKPSTKILNNQVKECKIYASDSDKGRIPPIIELIRDSEIQIQNCRVPFEDTLFRPEPPSLTIERFTPFKTYELVFSFRNMDQVPRKIRLEESKNAYFTVSGWTSCSLQSEKIAPGMEVSYIVKFKPEENVDYCHNLICITEREKFIVPIKVIGARGCLDFPDRVVFSDVPVLLSGSRTLLVRNIGEVTAKFRIHSQEPFNVTPDQGSLEVNETMQIIVDFSPTHSGNYSSSFTVKYDTGDEIKVELVGTAININLRLDKSSIKLENSITLTGRKSIKIFNRSDHLVKYVWKLCANVAEENHLKAKRSLELLEKEQDDFNYLAVKNSELVGLSLLRQKYKNLNREIQANDYPFESLVFRIEPNEGVIWPKSSVDVNIFFAPTKVGCHNEVAYCKVQGRDIRLPLQLKGSAIGPKAKFAFTVFSINEIFINTRQKYEILLENLGNIPTCFSLRDSDSLFGPQFTFNPRKGIINVREQILIDVVFEPDTLGQFDETFLWDLEGGIVPLQVSFEGSVIGPTFKFDVDRLILNRTSFGFSSSKKFQIMNTSSIPLNYSVEIEEGEGKDDFKITPSIGTIGPHLICNFELQFSPQKLGQYFNFIALNVESANDAIVRLPIEAESVFPEIKIQNDMIDLGDCYLDYKYFDFDSITLVNESEFWATFSIDGRDNEKNMVYSVEHEQTVGIINPFSVVTIKTKFKLKRVGLVVFPIFVRIHGNSDSPLTFNVSATGIGPEVAVDKNEINWEKIPVLTSISREIILHNLSPIPATIIGNLVGENSCFSIGQKKIVIPPGDKQVLLVTAHLDDTTLMSNVLKIVTQNGSTHDILLVAKGIGSTIVYDIGLENYNFPNVFSSHECSTSFTFYNKGRKIQHLNWTHATTKDPAILANQIFEVFPSRFTLKPNSHQVVFFKGYSHVPIKIVDKILCHVTADKSPMRKLLLEAHLSVEFITPLLEVNPSSLKFKSTHTTDDSFLILTQNLNIKNNTTLPLTAYLKSTKPFVIAQQHNMVELQASESYDIPISFDPSHNLSRISMKENSKLCISYKDHPQKDHVQLHSETYFPNVMFTVQQIQFGCIQNNIEQRKVFHMKNTSILPVLYQWYFVLDEHDSISTVTQAFDFRPIRGVINPNSTEEVQVFYYGHPNTKIKICAICDVSGGPKYELKLSGEAAEYKYSFDHTVLDFGVTSYQHISDKEIILNNMGNVGFDFNVKILCDNSLLRQKIMVYPATGWLAKGARQKFIIRFSPLVPEDLNEKFYIQVAHFEPTEIIVISKTTFPCLSIGLPRINQNDVEPGKEFEVKDSKQLYERDRSYLKNATIDFIQQQSKNINNYADHISSNFV